MADASETQKPEETVNETADAAEAPAADAPAEDTGEANDYINTDTHVENKFLGFNVCQLESYFL